MKSTLTRSNGSASSFELTATLAKAPTRQSTELWKLRVSRKPLKELRVVLTFNAEYNDLDVDEVKSIMLGTVVAQGQVVARNFENSLLDGKSSSHHNVVFTAVETKPTQIVKITKTTQVIMSNDAEAVSRVGVGYDRIRGR